MNRLLINMWPKMAEEGNSGGGEQKPPAGEQKPPAGEQKPPAGEQKPPAGEQKPPAGEQKPPAGEQKPPAGEQNPVNLLDDDEQQEELTPPTEEEVKSFRDGLKAIDLGEGVTFDDKALDAMMNPLMELTGKSPEKAEKIVKAYTEYRRAEIAQAQAQRDAFINGLVKLSNERFGKDIKNVTTLAKAGGRKIFGDKLWNEMRTIPEFANNPDIIERLAAFGRTVREDQGAVKKEVGTEHRSGDWRTNMYGGKK